MKIYLRLYAVHDIDLINLKEQGLDFKKIFVEVLNCAIKKKPYVFPYKEDFLNRNKDFSKIKYSGTYRYRFTLNEKTDKDVCEYLKSIKPLKRNSFIKNVIRRSVPILNLSTYSTNEDVLILNNQVESKNNLSEKLGEKINDPHLILNKKEKKKSFQKEDKNNNQKQRQAAHDLNNKSFTSPKLEENKTFIKDQNEKSKSLLESILEERKFSPQKKEIEEVKVTSSLKEDFSNKENSNSEEKTIVSEKEKKITIEKKPYENKNTSDTDRLDADKAVPSNSNENEEENEKDFESFFDSHFQDILNQFS